LSGDGGAFVDKEFMAVLREQQRIRAENRKDMRWLDGCLKKLSHEAVKRSLDLLKRTERKPLTRIATPPDGGSDRPPESA
jgi:hypothetical protein